MPDDRSSLLADAPVVLCSACLLGYRCRYNGADKHQLAVDRALAGKAVVPICPEEAGGLPTPRQPADLAGGSGAAVLTGAARVIAADGTDVTEAFRQGAELALRATQRYGASVALLKEGSPSCGVRRVRVDGKPIEGMGVTAAALDRAGVAVISDEDLPSWQPQPGTRSP